MATTMRKVNGALARKHGGGNLTASKRGSKYYTGGHFIKGMPVEFIGPRRMNDWSVEKFIFEVEKVYDGQHPRRLQELNEDIEKTLRLIARLEKMVDKNDEKAHLFRRAVKKGLGSYSRIASKQDLRKRITTDIAGAILRELLDKTRNFHINQKNCVDHIYRILYNWNLSYGRTKTKTNLIGDKAMPEKTTKKKATKKKTASKGTESIKDLLAQLEATADQIEKRKLRAKLRSRGHAGGLGKRTATKKKATKKKTTKKKATKKKTSRK